MAFDRLALGKTTITISVLGALAATLAGVPRAAAEGPVVIVEAGVQGPGVPVVVVEQPPPLRTHEGVYIRAAIGGGGLVDTIHYGFGIFDVDGRASGPSGAGELALGWGVSRGIALGAMLTIDWVTNPRFEVEGSPAPLDVSVGALVMFGPFIDWYTNPDGGFHLQGFVGGARITTRDDSGTMSEADEEPIGAGLGIGAGYDFRLGDKVGLGAIFRLTGAHLQADNFRHDVFAANLLLALTVF